MGAPAGVPLRKLTDDELAYILGTVKYADSIEKPRMQVYEELAIKFGVTVRTIYKHVMRLSPTVNLAQARLRAGAARMALNIIKKGTVSEHIQVLSRPNIGVLDPPTKDGGGGGGGLFLSIEMNSLGAMRMGVAAGSRQALPAPKDDIIDVMTPPADDFLPLSNLNEAEHPTPEPKGLLATSLERSRAALAAARVKKPGLSSLVRLKEKEKGVKRVKRGPNKAEV